MINSKFHEFNLEEPIIRALEALGYLEPTEVQEQVIKQVLAGQDMIVQSQTGSGKTAAFGIPLCNNIEIDENRPQVLVLTPTRELAVQVSEEIGHIGKLRKIRSLPVYGKQPIHIQMRQLKQRVHVVVGTPGRLYDLIHRKNLDLSAIKYLVIDEADELLNRGFLEDVEAIISKIPDSRCTLLFSATIPPKIEDICSKHMRDAQRIQVESDEPTTEKIKQFWFEVADDWKFQKLLEKLETHHPENCMIFCNTRERANQLIVRMQKSDLSCCLLHGGMPQKERLRSISMFKKGEVPILVATDLAARGIHVDQLDLVINYNIPTELENYVHRIGRTGRNGEDGLALSFVSVHEKAKWLEIQEFIGYTVPQGDASKTQESKPAGGSHHGLKNLKPVSAHAKKPNKTVQKEESIHKGIARIRINAGKGKKMRAGDILGAISNMAGIEAGDIGIIDIQDTCTYVEIFHNKGGLVMKGLAQTKIKGKEVKGKIV